MPVEYICATCGGTFYTPPSHPRIFCSQACRAGRAPLAIPPRYWPRVAKGPDHWMWTGGKTTAGYGLFYLAGHQSVYAHRVAWELASGAPVPPGRQVLHTCDVPGCVRNDEPGSYEVRGVLLPRYGHLFLGDDAINAFDKADKERSTLGDRHGLRLRPERVARGERSGGAKLTEAQVLTIRSRYAAGDIAQRELAEAYGVSDATISMVLAGKRWRHV